MLDLLKQWQINQQIRPIDFHFAKFMAQLGADNLMQLAAALSSQQLGEGHICLPIDKIGDLFHQHCRQLGVDSQAESERLQVACIFHDQQQTHSLLIDSQCCGEKAPLRVEHNALFMARYAEFEQLIADKLLLNVDIEVSEASREYLEVLFKPQYAYLWCAWKNVAESADLLIIQSLCVKYLDVIENAEIDWIAVETIFNNAKSEDDLSVLNDLITKDKKTPGYFSKIYCKPIYKI